MMIFRFAMYLIVGGIMLHNVVLIQGTLAEIDIVLDGLSK